MANIAVNSIAELRQFIGQQKKRVQRESFVERYTWPEEEPLADWELELLNGRQVEAPEREREHVDFSGQL